MPQIQSSHPHSRQEQLGRNGQDSPCLSFLLGHSGSLQYIFTCISLARTVFTSSYSHKGDEKNVYFTLVASLTKGAGATGLGRSTGPLAGTGSLDPRSVGSELCVLARPCSLDSRPLVAPHVLDMWKHYPAIPRHLVSPFPLCSSRQACFSVSFHLIEVENCILFCTHSSVSFGSKSGICILCYHDQ